MPRIDFRTEAPPSARDFSAGAFAQTATKDALSAIATYEIPEGAVGLVRAIGCEGPVAVFQDSAFYWGVAQGSRLLRRLDYQAGTLSAEDLHEVWIPVKAGPVSVVVYHSLAADSTFSGRLQGFHWTAGDVKRPWEG